MQLLQLPIVLVQLVAGTAGIIVGGVQDKEVEAVEIDLESQETGCEINYPKLH